MDASATIVTTTENMYICPTCYSLNSFAVIYHTSKPTDLPDILLCVFNVHLLHSDV